MNIPIPELGLDTVYASKARDVAGEFHKAYFDRMECKGGCKFIEILTPLIAAAIAAERERCCKAVCDRCENTKWWQPAVFDRTVSGGPRFWHHEATEENPTEWVALPCIAAAIRAARESD